MIAMAIPVHADVSDAAGYVVGEFWDMMTGQEHDMFFDYWKNFVGYLAGEECPSSPDKYHHGNVPVGGIGVFGSGGTDDNGKFVWHTCDYCGEQFKVYASDLQQSYDAQVSELQSTYHTVNVDMHGLSNLIIKDWTFSPNALAPTTFSVDSEYLVGEFFCDPRSAGRVEIWSSMIFSVPTSGKYRFSFPALNIYTVNSSWRFYTIFLQSSLDGENWGGNPLPLNSSNANGVVENGLLSVSPFSFEQSLSTAYQYRVGLAFDFILVDEEASFSEFSYSASDYVYLQGIQAFPSGSSIVGVDSRPTSITGDYGIIGDNGQIIKVEGDKIVNETNNTYYNPSTGETKTMSDWSYNYEDRSYTVTTESGDTVTITYGDENVVIKEGDTTYNVYYLVNGSGSENPDPGPDVPPACNHQWAETSVTPATCTVPGSRTLTCSLCNETKTETIPAPGHKWTIKQEVKNEYDENGNQTQEGFTIWECSVCGEQQKTTDGTAPPGGGSGTGSGSSGGVFSGIFGLLVDFLGFFWNTFRDFVGEGVRGFLNALMDGTSSIFGLLNPFNWGG